MGTQRHRRPATWWTVVGLTAVAAVVSSMTDVSSAFHDWFGGADEKPSVQVVVPSPSTDRADALRISVVDAGAGGDPTCVRTQYLLPGGIGDLRGDPPAPQAEFGPSEMPQWFAAHRGVPVVDTVVLLVENVQHGSAVLRDLRAVVDRWEPAQSAARAMATGFGCGGHLDIQYLDLALRDTRQPIPAVPNPSGKGFPFTVADDDPDQFVVTVAHPAGLATWHLELRWTFGGQQRTTRVPADGGAFHTGPGPLFCAETVPELVRLPRRCRD
jgi:hypothetical protein